MASGQLGVFLFLIVAFVSATWNPEYDPIYDPITGLCHIDGFPEFKFFPHEFKSSKVFQSIEIPPSRTSPLFLSPPQPQDQIPIFKKSPNFEHSSVSSLCVPVKCLAFERKWDFYSGKPEALYGEVIGWVSRIGFVDNLIHEFNFGTSVFDSYTLLPHRFCTKSYLAARLSKGETSYLEIKCPESKLFSVLYGISGPVDHNLRNVILAINISFIEDRFNGSVSVSIKIIVDRKLDSRNKSSTFDQLRNLNRLIENYHYRPYPELS